MYSVAAAIWNEIAKKEHLQTKWASKMFKLDQDELVDELNQQGSQMESRGISSAVSLAYLTVMPLLLENVAISQFIVNQNRESLRSALPEACSVNEAVILASMDHPLTMKQQKELSGLLQSSIAYNEENKTIKKKPKFQRINFERFGRDFFNLYFVDQKYISITALSKVLGVGGSSKWRNAFQAWVEMWELPYKTVKGRMVVTPELLTVWFEREYNRRRSQ